MNKTKRKPSFIKISEGKGGKMYVKSYVEHEDNVCRLTVTPNGYLVRRVFGQVRDMIVSVFGLSGGPVEFKIDFDNWEKGKPVNKIIVTHDLNES